MDQNHFDDLTRALASSTSRRQALKLLGGGLLAALVPGSALAKGGGNSDCAKFCATTFGANTPAAKQCTADAAKGRGLCNQCGSASPSSICCTRNASGFCSSYSAAHCPCTTSVANATATCTNGTCGFTCTAGFANCDSNAGNGCETNLLTNPNNCGTCGNTCDACSTCQGGMCVSTCSSGQVCISNGTCVTSLCPAGFTDCAGGVFFCSTDLNCSCLLSTEGVSVCVNRSNFGCGSQSCSSSTQCLGGSVCVQDCGCNVCAPLCTP